MVKLTQSEKRVLTRIRQGLSKDHKRYDFWFIYDIDDEATGWEGGFELSLDIHFRNQYSLSYGKPNNIDYTKSIVKNWQVD